MEDIGVLNLVRSIDPRTDVNSRSRRTYSVYDGGSDFGFQRISPDGSVSNSQLSYTLNPPSTNVFVNRRLLHTVEFELTFTGQSAGPGIALLQSAGAQADVGVSTGTQYYDAPRAFPLANATLNSEFQINNDRVTQNVNNYFRAFPRYNNLIHNQDITQSLTPTMLDQSQEYSDLDGFARSPLRGYGDNVLQCPRGGFVGYRITQNGTTGAPGQTAVVRLRVTEPVFLSPFLFEDGSEDTGLYGIQNMKYTVSLGGRGNGALAGLGGALWSHSSLGSTFTSCNVTVVEAEMLMMYITPDPLQQIPKNNLYSYYEPALYPTQTQTPITAGALTTIAMNNVQLNSIPNRIFLFVSENDNQNSMLKSDVYFGIENVSISFDNRDNLLSNATSEQLYQMAVKNGTNLSWNQWTKDCGSVLALDFGSDIPLRLSQAVGLRGNYNLRITVQCRNLKSTTVTPTFNCVVISEGVMSIDDQQVTRSIGVLDQNDIFDVKSMPSEVYHPSGSVYGGNFMTGLKKFATGVYRGVKKYARPVINAAQKLVPIIAPEFSPYVSKADEVARAIGLGLEGRGMVGGRKLNRKQLARLLEE